MNEKLNYKDLQNLCRRLLNHIDESVELFAKLYHQDQFKEFKIFGPLKIKTDTHLSNRHSYGDYIEITDYYNVYKALIVGVVENNSVSLILYKNNTFHANLVFDVFDIYINLYDSISGKSITRGWYPSDNIAFNSNKRYTKLMSIEEAPFFRKVLEPLSLIEHNQEIELWCILFDEDVTKVSNRLEGSIMDDLKIKKYHAKGVYDKKNNIIISSKKSRITLCYNNNAGGPMITMFVEKKAYEKIISDIIILTPTVKLQPKYLEPSLIDDNSWVNI